MDPAASACAEAGLGYPRTTHPRVDGQLSPEWSADSSTDGRSVDG